MSGRSQCKSDNTDVPDRQALRANTNTARAQNAAMILSDSEHLDKYLEDHIWPEMGEMLSTEDSSDSPPPVFTFTKPIEQEWDTGSDHDAWSEGSEASFKMKIIDGSPIRMRFFSKYEPLVFPPDPYPSHANHDHNRSPAATRSRTPTTNGKEHGSLRRQRPKLSNNFSYDNSVCTCELEMKFRCAAQRSLGIHNTCSLPRSVLAEPPKPQSMMGNAVQTVHRIFKTGVRSSIGTLSAMPPTGTLRRCLGAFKEALDELGDVWDGHGEHGGHEEAIDLGVDHDRTVSAPVTPAKHSPAPPVTPGTRLLLGPVQSRPTHFETLTPSPVAAFRSSKRARKSRLRYKSPTPIRRKHGFDIDHSYSTEDESSDPHSRLRNKLLLQDPSRMPHDNFYVFMYKQDSRTGSINPDSENNKPNLRREQEPLSLNPVEDPAEDSAELPPLRSRAPVADALGSSVGLSARRSVANLNTGECQHGVLRSQQTCEFCDDVESGSAQSRLAQNASTPLISQDDIESRTRLLGRGEAVASSSTQLPGDAPPHGRATTPDNLRADVEAIFYGHANGNKAVDRKGRDTSGLKFSERVKEALRPRHPDVLKLKPGPWKRSKAEPATNSSFHISDDGTSHQVVEHPPTRSSDRNADARTRLTDNVASEIPRAEGSVNEWLQHVEPQGDIPHEALDGTEIPEPPSRVEPSSSDPPSTGVPLHPKKAKRRPRLPESCAVLSATVPPERDTTDLLITPFLTFQQEITVKPPSLPNERSGETLMSTFGVSYDIVPAHHDSRLPGLTFRKEAADLQMRTSQLSGQDLMSAFGLTCDGAAHVSPKAIYTISPADDAMSQSAAMGTPTMLSNNDSEIRQRNTEVNRVKQGTAESQNTSWFRLDDREKMPCCWNLPAKRSRAHSEYQAWGVYNLHNMFQSMFPCPSLTMINQWIRIDRCVYTMQDRQKHA